MKKKVLTAIIIIILAAAAAAAAAFFAVYGDRSPGWHDSVAGFRYYADESGEIARGYRQIEGEPYYFDRFGRPYEKGWIADPEGSEAQYYCTGGGKLLTGWHYIDGKAWYFYEESAPDKGVLAGETARNITTPGGIVIGETGYIDGEEGEALGYGIDVLNRFGWDLVSAYKYSGSLRYADGRETDYGLRIHKCALKGFRDGEGNCLAWAGTFCTMARLLGYDCRMVWGTLWFRGEYVTHAWTEIPEEDGIHVYDPRHRAGKDLSGFDVRYGDPGTYKYNEETKQYLEW